MAKCNVFTWRGARSFRISVREGYDKYRRDTEKNTEKHRVAHKLTITTHHSLSKTLLISILIYHIDCLFYLLVISSDRFCYNIRILLRFFPVPLLYRFTNAW